MDKIDIIEWSKKESALLLLSLPKRWKHIQGVAEKATLISKILKQNERPILIAAAYLHDIGYSPEINKTGFHPLDGAIYLQSKNQDRLASIVAYHSIAKEEALLIGLDEKLSKFEVDNSIITDALTYCDMTTNSNGDKVSFKQRIDDIYSRYDQDSIVIKSINSAMPRLNQILNRIESEIARKS